MSWASGVREPRAFAVPAGRLAAQPRSAARCCARRVCSSSMSPTPRWEKREIGPALRPAAAAHRGFQPRRDDGLPPTSGRSHAAIASGRRHPRRAVHGSAQRHRRDRARPRPGTGGRHHQHGRRARSPGRRSCRRDGVTAIAAVRDWESRVGAFSGVNLSIPVGQVVAIMGVEGSGGRELVRSLAGSSRVAASTSSSVAAQQGSAASRTCPRRGETASSRTSRSAPTWQRDWGPPRSRAGPGC